MYFDISMNKQVLKVFKALSDETRVDIIRRIVGKREVPCQKLSNKFDLSQPTLSHHFNKLIDANILKVKKEGTNHFYSIDNKFLNSLGINIAKIIGKN